MQICFIRRGCWITKKLMIDIRFSFFVFLSILTLSGLLVTVVHADGLDNTAPPEVLDIDDPSHVTSNVPLRMPQAAFPLAVMA